MTKGEISFKDTNDVREKKAFLYVESISLTTNPFAEKVPEEAILYLLRNIQN